MNPVRPVLVTGAPRSGTTWVGQMLAAAPELYYIHEPFNPDYHPGSGVCNVRFAHHQTYITEYDENKYFTPIKDMIDGRYNITAALLACRSLDEIKKVWVQKRLFQERNRVGMRPLIKDPIALMSAGWLSKRFDMNVVVMVRHPAAIAASMKRLHWGFDPARWALAQKQLMADYLHPFEDELTHLKDAGSDIIGQIALFWKIAYFMVLKYKEKYPHWIYLRHEDISRDPLPAYEKLYQQLGLSLTDEARESISDSSSESNPSRSRGDEKLIKMNSKKVTAQWKKALSAQEIGRIRETVEEVSASFYSDKDWEIGLPE
jgi:hypothetical protein